jgi:hypothetical protein
MDGAFVTPNDCLHSVENRLEQTAVTIRIAVSDELRRRDDVREQHSDLLAFVVESCRKAGDAAGCTIGPSGVRRDEKR